MEQAEGAGLLSTGVLGINTRHASDSVADCEAVAKCQSRCGGIIAAAPSRQSTRLLH
jgi:hypothetical protein